MIEALPQVLNSPENLTARAQIQYGAVLCGLVLGQIGMSLHHKLRHTLGGSFDLPHAVILLHAIACNEFAMPDMQVPIAMLLGAKIAGQGLFSFAHSLHAPTSLRSMGLKETDLDRAADLAALDACWNPRPIDPAAILALLQAA